MATTSGHRPFTPATAFAPGRVNLIGEHTDYNAGLALPFAIEQGVTVTATRSDAGRVLVVARDLRAADAFALARPRRVGGWRAFARGAVAELTDAGARLVGARLEVHGTVAREAGLSSSAALSVALCLALLAVAGEPIPDPVSLARVCSRVENRWVGARTGLLDQLASLCGAAGAAVLIDFRTLATTPVALTLDGHRLVTLDSGERRALSGRRSVGYNDRREECARAAAWLGLPSLREADWAMTARLPPPLRDRARHVVGENERVRAAVAALGDGDLARLGRLLDESHESQRELFAVSTDAVEAARRRLLDAGALGARLVGGGFGGHVLGLLGPGCAAPPGAVEVTPAAGARVEIAGPR